MSATLPGAAPYGPPRFGVRSGKASRPGPAHTMLRGDGMDRRRRWAALWAAGAVLAAVLARGLLPGPAAAAEAWLLGPAGNRVTAAFAALEDAFGDGVGEAVAAFCAELSGDAGR